MGAKDIVITEVCAYQCPDGKKYIRGRTGDIFLYSPALGEEGGEHNGPRRTQLLLAEVSFSHGCLNSDRWPLFVICDAREGEFRQRPNGRSDIRGRTADILDIRATYLHFEIASAMISGPSGVAVKDP